jgi:hypothetical protein
VIVVALVQGLFFGAATLAAAAWIAGKATSRAPLAAFASPPSSPSPPARAARVRSGTATLAEPEPPAPTPMAAFDDVADEAPGLGRLEALSASGGGKTRASGVRAPLDKVAPAQPVLVDTPPPEDTASASVVAAPGMDGPWSRVAQAISDKDWTAADRALNDLSSDGDPSTRDAAELARAELAIARGRTGALRPLVERLARSGATGLIRKRALALLERLPVN